MKRLVIAALALAACTSASDPDSGGPVFEATISSWPTFSGDCQPHFTDTVRALDSSYYAESAVTVQDWVDGQPAPTVNWGIGVPPDQIGVPLTMDWSVDQAADVSLLIVNTTYTNRSNPDGEIQGTLTSDEFDTAIEFRFTGATLLGTDSVYAGTYHCGIDGVLRIESLTPSSDLGASQ